MCGNAGFAGEMTFQAGGERVTTVFSGAFNTFGSPVLADDQSLRLEFIQVAANSFLTDRK